MKSTKPRRITKACDQCSRFRRKCDGHLPCLLCREKGRTCTYTKPVRKRGPESSKPSDGSKTISTVKTSLEVDKMPFFNPSTLPVLLPKSTLPPLVNQIPISVETTVINSIAFENPVSRWSRKDFLVTRIVDVCGNVSTILDMYFGYPYQHIPIFSKLWIQQNLKDVPMYVLHAMYILVLTNPKFAVPNGRLTARPHLAYVRNEINNLIEDCDPFTIAAMINVALYYFYLKDETPQIAYISLAMKESQLLGLNRDVNLNWRSTASGRMLGHEIGMDKNFLRSMWFLLYQWDHHNVLVYHNPLMIDSLISDSAVNSYVPPNVGDSSNIPLNFLTHSQYVVPLLSLAKQVFMVDSHFDRMELLYRLDTFHLTLPISYLPQSTIFLGRTVNWIMEIFHYSKFCLLIPLYLDPYFIPFDKLYVPTNLESSITAMLNTALAFITYSNNQVDYDSTFLFYSKTMFIAALCYCVMRKVKVGVIEAFMEAIRLTGYPQDYDLLWEGSRDPDKAQLALLELLTF